MVNDIEVKIGGSPRPEPESPSGSTKTAACLQRSAREHGRPGPSPCDLWSAEACHDQPNEGVAGRVRECVAQGAINHRGALSTWPPERQSDPPIVVGDGNADHMAKGRAEE